MTTTAASRDALLAPAPRDARTRRVRLGYWLAAAIAIVAVSAAAGGAGLSDQRAPHSEAVPA